MTEPVKRPYRSDLRDEQARATRRRIREAATELFVERGYAGTSIAAIAERASVAPQTVFTIFKAKAALLAEAIDVALAGDDEPVAVYERMEADRPAARPSAAEAAATFARQSTEILERAGRLLQVADAAAQQDAELFPMWMAGHRGRRSDAARLCQTFADAGLLRPGLGVDQAADLLWALGSPETYRSFIVLADWTPARYEDWLRTTVATLLFR